MKLKLNLDTAYISSPFWEMLSTIVDYKNKVKNQQSETLTPNLGVGGETDKKETSEYIPSENKKSGFSNLKPQFNKSNLNFKKIFNFEKVKFVKYSPKKYSKIVLLILAIFLIGGFVVYKNQSKNQNVQASANSKDSFAVQKEITINKQFNIPIRTAKGDESGETLKVTLTTIDNTNKILIQGQPATARDGKSFLILNLEIENSTKNQLTVRPVDLIRMIDSQNKSFAPDIHNNDVTVEAISIKKTRAGYVIDSNQKKFKFLIGEVSGKKETVEVSLN